MDCVAERGPDLLAAQAHDRAWSPQAVRINGWRFSGTLDADTVVRAVCSGFTVPPKACDDMLEPFSSKWARAPEQRTVTLWTLAGITILFNAVAIICFAIYRHSLQKSVRKTVREEVMMEVQAQIADYMKLDGDN